MNINIAYTDDNFFFNADSVIRNEKNNTIKAKGNVSIKNKQYKLKADEIVYYLDKKKVVAKGNIIIFEKNGNVIYASEAELSNDLKNSFIKNIGVLISDNSRLAASSTNSIKRL